MIFLCNSDPAALHVLGSDEQNLRIQIIIIIIIQYAKKGAERPSPPIASSFLFFLSYVPDSVSKK